MPHINYKRGETRTFVIRHERVQRKLVRYYKGKQWESRSHSGLHERRRRRGRKGLTQWARLAVMLGIRNWCPCCVTSEFRPARGHSKSQANRRLISRLQRNENKRVIREAIDEYNDDRAG